MENEQTKILRRACSLSLLTIYSTVRAKRQPDVVKQSEGEEETTGTGVACLLQALNTVKIVLISLIARTLDGNRRLLQL